MIIKSPFLTILLEPQAHRYAQQFASEQINPVKGRQVYLNTLAVCGVHSYLKCLEIDSNLAASDCWNPIERTLSNSAALILPGLGKLECRYLLSEEQEVNIPLEARADRVGYVVVRLEEKLKQLELIGFIAPQQVEFDTVAIAIGQIQSIEILFETIAQLQNKVNLQQWLDRVFTTDWQPIEAILAGRITRSLATVNPATVTRGKTIQWQLNSLDREIILVLQVTAQSNRVFDLCLQLYPGNTRDYLPSGLSIEVRDETASSCLSARTKDTDDWIQLEFSCQQGEQFQVAMELDGVSAIEYFSVWAKQYRPRNRPVSAIDFILWSRSSLSILV